MHSKHNGMEQCLHWHNDDRVRLYLLAHIAQGSLSSVVGGDIAVAM